LLDRTRVLRISEVINVRFCLKLLLLLFIIIINTIPKNKSDITIPDNGEGTRMLVDTATSVERNVIKKEADMILKYEDLATETKRVEMKMIPVTTGATGTIQKSSIKYPSINHEINELQNTALLGTAHLLREEQCESIKHILCAK
jgi:hypothetical protein